MSWLKTAMAFEMSGPLVDSVIQSVQNMYSRGAPTQWDFSGFNKNDYQNQTLMQLRGLIPGSSVSSDKLNEATRVLLRYSRTQLPQAIELRQQFEKEYQEQLIQQPQQEGQQAPVPVSEIDEGGTHVIQMLGKGNYGKVKVLIPELAFRITPNLINKFLKQKAEELDWQQTPDNFGKFSYPLWKAYNRSKSEPNVVEVLPQFLPALANALQEYNSKAKAISKRKKVPLAFYDTTAIEGQDIQQEKKSVTGTVTQGQYGNEYTVQFDLPADNWRGFLDEFNSYVKETLGAWWPKFQKNTKDYLIKNLSDDKLPDLVSWFRDKEYEASNLDQLVQQVAELAKQKQEAQQEAQDPQQGYVLGVSLAYPQTPYHLALQVPEWASGMRQTFFEIIKFSFPIYKGKDEGNRLYAKDQKIYYVKGSYSDYADFGNLAKQKGFDVSQLRTAFLQLLQQGLIQEERLEGSLDGYESHEQFVQATKEIMPPGMSLFGPQEDGVEFLYSKSSALMGDETGAGKTAQAAVAAQMRMMQSGGQTVVVTLKTTQLQWAKEIQKFTGETDIYIPETNSKFDPNLAAQAKFTVLTYPMFSRNGKRITDHLKKMGITVLVLDECHHVKNESNRTTNLLNLAEEVPFKWGLSATISANRPIDVWRQLKAVGHRLGNLSEGVFRKNFAGQQYVKEQWGGSWENISGDSAMEAAMLLRSWLTDNSGVYIRRTKKEMNPNLPNHLIDTIATPLKPAQTKKLNAAIEERISQYRDPDLAISQMIAERTELAKAKVPLSLEWVDNILAQDKKVLVFTCFVEAAKDLADGAQSLVNKYNGGNVVTIIGGDKDRISKIDAFKSDPNTKVMVLSILTGGTGLDVPNIVDDVIMNDYSWTPKDAEQAEGRAFRVSSENDVTTRYIIAEGTVDETFFDKVQEKRKLAAIIDHPKSLEELKKANARLQQINQEMVAAAKKRVKKRKDAASNWLIKIV